MPTFFIRNEKTKKEYFSISFNNNLSRDFAIVSVILVIAIIGATAIGIYFGK